MIMPANILGGIFIVDKVCEDLDLSGFAADQNIFN